MSSGCAPMLSGAMNASLNNDDVIAKAAKFFSTSPDNVTVTSIEKNTLTTTYHAKHSGQDFDCQIYYGEVSCKPGASTSTVVPAAAKGRPVDAQMSPLDAQMKLNQLGYQVGTPDGVFGKRSVEKLKLFQKSRGLAVTGNLDDATVAALR